MATWGRTTGGSFGLTSSIVMPGAMWVHLALVYDGSWIRLWQNGSMAIGTMRSGGPLRFDTSDIVLGADVDTGAVTLHLDGRLDEVRIYDRTLSDAEISMLASP